MSSGALVAYAWRADFNCWWPEQLAGRLPPTLAATGTQADPLSMRDVKELATC